MSTDHRLTVAIAESDLAGLAGAGACLYAFLGYETSNRASRPLVFHVAADLAPTLSIGWSESYLGLVSATLLGAGDDPGQRTIRPAASVPVRLGQTLTVSPTFGLTATNIGVAGAFQFESGHSGEVTCGLACDPGAMPICAAPLMPGIGVALAPVQTVFLMLSTSAFERGSWVEASAGQGLLVDMAGTEARTVTFDSAAPKCWREADQGWASAVPPGRPLADLLRRAPQRNIPRSNPSQDRRHP